MRTFDRLFTLSLFTLAACSAPPSPTEGSSSNAAENRVDAEAESPTLPSDFESRSATLKQSFMWDERIISTEYGALPGWPRTDLFGLLRLDLRFTLDNTSDELARGRKKLVHALGTVAKVEFVPAAGSPYTGVFRGGIGVARLSLAKDPGSNDFTPGMALKFFIDGLPSSNIAVMPSLDGQEENFNFFATTFNNIIATPRFLSRIFIADLFKRATKFPGHLSPAELAVHRTDGTLEGAPVAPYQIYFTPTTQAQFEEAAHGDFRDDLATLPVGTKLFDVSASDSDGADAHVIGTLVTTSRFVASSYGDERLFFRHPEFVP